MTRTLNMCRPRIAQYGKCRHSIEPAVVERAAGDGACEFFRARRGQSLDVVKVTTFLANREYGMLNRGVRRQVLGDRCPASTTIVADIFDSEWLVEIEAIAAA